MSTIKLKYFIGFLLASLIQASIVFAGENLNLSTLNPNFSLTQLLTHVAVGQIVGWLLFYIVNNTETIGNRNKWLVGTIYGILVWSIVLPIAASRKVIDPSWMEGNNLLISLTAFLVFGLVASYTTYLKAEEVV